MPYRPRWFWSTAECKFSWNNYFPQKYCHFKLLVHFSISSGNTGWAAKLIGFHCATTQSYTSWVALQCPQHAQILFIFPFCFKTFLLFFLLLFFLKLHSFEMQKYSDDFWSTSLPWIFVEMVSGPADSRKAVRTRRVFTGRGGSSGRRLACRAARASPRQNQSFVSFFHQPTLIVELADTQRRVWSHLGWCLKSLWCTADLFGRIDRPETKLRSSSRFIRDPTAASPLDERSFDY